MVTVAQSNERRRSKEQATSNGMGRRTASPEGLVKDVVDEEEEENEGGMDVIVVGPSIEEGLGSGSGRLRLETSGISLAASFQKRIPCNWCRSKWIPKARKACLHGQALGPAGGGKTWRGSLCKQGEDLEMDA